MGFFDRISNVWKGKVSNSLSQMENRNPEAVYEAAIAERERNFKELKQAAAGIAQLRDKTREELEKSQRELSQVMPGIEVAVSEGDEDVALVLIQQKDSLEARIPELQHELEKLEGQAAETVEGLRAFRAEIDKLRREKDEMLARKASAEARIQTQETLSGISQDSDVKALANVRANIEQMHSDANEGLLDGDGVSMRHKVEKARERMAESSARAQLEAMKAQLAGKKGGAEAPARTLGDPAPSSDEAPADEPAPEDEAPKRSL